MNTQTHICRAVLLTCLFACLCVFEAKAIKPEWVRKGEPVLNQRRTNDSYEFKVFKTEDVSLTCLHENRYMPLLNYLEGRYQSDIKTMRLDSLMLGDDSRRTIRVYMETPEGWKTVLARPIDEYDEIDYNVVSDPVFEYYQLYAVGRPDSDMVLDEITVEKPDRLIAGIMSVIPGCGQFYKGDTIKGAALLGTGLAAAGAAIVFDRQAAAWKVAMGKGGNKESWESKIIGMKRLRNVSLGALGGLCVFSVVDALVKDSSPVLNVRRGDGNRISVSPYGAGIALFVEF